jgi:AraC family transcriptional regulator
MERELIDRSIDYILAHLNDGLTARSVAEHFHYSETYFNRGFKVATGKSLYEFIMRLKMDQSAVELKLQRDKRVTDVGLDYGYSSTNYSTAFTKHHSMSPSTFRESVRVDGMPSPFYPQGRRAFADFAEYDRQITVQELPERTVIYERVVGNYIDLRRRWPEFLAANRRYRKPDTRCIERFYDDPAVTDPSGCIYDLCMTVDGVNMPENTSVLAGGRYAVYPYEGRIEDIFCAVQGVFSVWLPRSGYVMAQRCALNVYREMDEGGDMVAFDLCIPVEQGGNSEVGRGALPL